MTREENIALECACDVAAGLLEQHLKENCCCQSYGQVIADGARKAPDQSLVLLRHLRDATELSNCQCCLRTQGLIRGALMRYEYELSKAQIKEILGS